MARRKRFLSGAPRRLDLIAIHCAATKDGQCLDIADINRWHRDRGFKRHERTRRAYKPVLGAVEYHWLIEPNGDLVCGRHVNEPGAHAAGWNQFSIGICLAGTSRFTLRA